MPLFRLSRATVEDLPELLKLMYNCFSTWTTTRYMGCFSLDDVPKFVAKYTTIMNEDPTDIWMKVTDNDTGKIVAASNWKLYLGSDKAIKRGRDEPPEWLTEEQKERSRELLEPLNEARIPANADPFLHVHIFYTSPDYRRRGAGAMMMQWANDLADSLFLPCWVEASKDGTGLYKQFGYYETSTIKLGGEGDEFAVAMRRDARTTPIEGGKASAN